MKKRNKMHVFSFVLFFSLLPTHDLCAAKYGAVTASKEFSAQKSESEKKPLPPEAIRLSEEDLKSVAPVSFEEMHSFVRDWIQYSRWIKTEGNQYETVAYLGVSNTSDYPVEVVKWMDSRGWSVDRFFLLERKFKITLSVLEQETKQANFLKILEDQLKQIENNSSLTREERDPMTKEIYRKIAKVKEATGMKAPVSPEEYDLIKMNKGALTKIFQ